MTPVLVWFRNDLRLADNPALCRAGRTGRPVIPVFVFDEAAGRPIGFASRWWLHGSLQALAVSLQAVGSRLVLRRGAATDVIEALTREAGAAAVYWNRQYDPALSELDRAIEDRLRVLAIEPRTSNAALLFEPWAIRTGTGAPYKVFAPFWRRCMEQSIQRPLPPPATLAPPTAWPASESLDGWRLRDSGPERTGDLRALWEPGEAGASCRLEDFERVGVTTYESRRDRPGADGTSKLSPHLHFGEIGPRQIAEQLLRGGRVSETHPYLRQLGWREFSYHLLFHHPDLGDANLRSDFDRMPWRDCPTDLRRWQQGLTGYPLVDAGMRELLTTGWMHNRVRMVSASFLTKHLLIDWRLGAAWFWQMLVDADWANNNAGWQWVAGTGTDAAPYIRIFNPVTQSRRFDPAGDYLRTWLPQLARLPDRFIHAPWTASRSILAQAGVRLGETYPDPIVDHAAARSRALAIYRRKIRSGPNRDT